MIEFYDDPAKIVPNAINRDSLLAKPLGLTDKEKADLEGFLIALTDKLFGVSKKYQGPQKQNLRELLH